MPRIPLRLHSGTPPAPTPDPEGDKDWRRAHRPRPPPWGRSATRLAEHPPTQTQPGQAPGGADTRSGRAPSPLRSGSGGGGGRVAGARGTRVRRPRRPVTFRAARSPPLRLPSLQRAPPRSPGVAFPRRLILPAATTVRTAPRRAPAPYLLRERYERRRHLRADSASGGPKERGRGRACALVRKRDAMRAQHSQRNDRPQDQSTRAQKGIQSLPRFLR